MYEPSDLTFDNQNCYHKNCLFLFYPYLTLEDNCRQPLNRNRLLKALKPLFLVFPLKCFYNFVIFSINLLGNELKIV